MTLRYMGMGEACGIYLLQHQSLRDWRKNRAYVQHCSAFIPRIPLSVKQVGHFILFTNLFAIKTRQMFSHISYLLKNGALIIRETAISRVFSIFLLSPSLGSFMDLKAM